MKPICKLRSQMENDTSSAATASATSDATPRPRLLLSPAALGRIHAMHARSSESAAAYVAVILAIYAAAMLGLLLHHVQQKYGQITLYDIYSELAPSGGFFCYTSGGGEKGEKLWPLFLIEPTWIGVARKVSLGGSRFPMESPLMS